MRFSRRVAVLLRRAMALKHRRGTISDHGYAVLRGKVHAELDQLLAGTYTDPDNARLAKLLRKHRDSVLRFLDHDGVDATNNLAEREGRPAVIARKLSGGNRTEAGAETHAVLASAFRTMPPGPRHPGGGGRVAPPWPGSCPGVRPHPASSPGPVRGRESHSTRAYRVTYADPVNRYLF